MNVTFNPSHKTNHNNQNTSFKGGVPLRSVFLKPFERGMNKLTDGIADYYSGFAFSNGVTNWLSKREKLDKVVGHMQTAGSVIISGMYMTKTLQNRNLDEERKKTLAVNQGLTLLFSTMGAYFLDNKLADFWNKHVSDKYIASHLNLAADKTYPGIKNPNMTKKELEQFIKEEKAWRKAENIRLMKEGLKKHQEYIKNLYLENHPDDIKLVKFKKPDLMHYIEKGLKNKELTGKLKGLNALKSLLVFGTVYRFIGPVAVTPVANWIGNIFFSGNTKKQVSETKKDMPIQAISNVKPKIDKFLAKA